MHFFPPFRLDSKNEQLWRGSEEVRLRRKTFAVLPMAHGDHHALWIDPKNAKRMIEGDDGGATVTLNGGASWSTQRNQPTAALFSLAIDDQVLGVGEITLAVQKAYLDTVNGGSDRWSHWLDYVTAARAGA